MICIVQCSVRRFDIRWRYKFDEIYHSLSDDITSLAETFLKTQRSCVTSRSTTHPRIWVTLFVPRNEKASQQRGNFFAKKFPSSRRDWRRETLPIPESFIANFVAVNRTWRFCSSAQLLDERPRCVEVLRARENRSQPSKLCRAKKHRRAGVSLAPVGLGHRSPLR